MSRDWQKDMERLTLEREHWRIMNMKTDELDIGIHWLQQYAAEKERSGRLQEEIARINCDYYADKQRFHDRGRELEEAKERADKAEEREKVLKHAFIVMLGYVPKTARVALDFDEVLASLYPKEETKPAVLEEEEAK